MERPRLADGTFGSPYPEPVDEKTLSTKVPRRIFDKVDAIAKTAGMTRAQWLREVAIAQAIDRHIAQSLAALKSNKQQSA